MGFDSDRSDDPSEEAEVEEEEEDPRSRILPPPPPPPPSPPPVPQRPWKRQRTSTSYSDSKAALGAQFSSVLNCLVLCQDKGSWSGVSNCCFRSRKEGASHFCGPSARDTHACHNKQTANFKAQWCCALKLFTVVPPERGSQEWAWRAHSKHSPMFILRSPFKGIHATWYSLLFFWCCFFVVKVGPFASCLFLRCGPAVAHHGLRQPTIALNACHLVHLVLPVGA